MQSLRSCDHCLRKRFESEERKKEQTRKIKQRSETEGRIMATENSLGDSEAKPVFLSALSMVKDTGLSYSCH